VTGCANKAAQQQVERPPAPVNATAAIARDVPTYIDAVGKTVAREVVSIQPQVSGRILKIHFTDGANVKKGEMLFTIDPTPFQAALRQAQANVSRDIALKKQAESNLASEIAKANWGRVQVSRYTTLVGQGVVSREQYEELRANQNSLEANVASARAAVNSAEESIKVDNAAVESAKVQLGYCSIRSPIDGRAGQRLADQRVVHRPAVIRCS
jgi:multidrug efflux system membrane fusion protein